MSNKPPSNIAKQIKTCTYVKADEFGYLTRSRIQNGEFLDRLVSDPLVGELLTNYMSRAEIRTYIKDAILNRYSKDKTLESHPQDISTFIESKLGIPCTKTENCKALKISLYRGNTSHANDYIVVANGTYLKWETALRKAILFIADKPFSENNANKIHIVLNIFAQNKKIPSSDKVFLSKALQRFDATLNIFGE